MNKCSSTLSIAVLLASHVFVPGNLLYAQVSDGAGSQGKPVVEVRARIESASEAQLILKVGVRNVGGLPVYLVTDPKRVDRSKGPYIDTSKADSSTLICSLQLYPPDPFEAYVNGTGVHLTRLAPGESHEETLRLTWPIRTTAPPFSDYPQKRVVPAQSIKRIEVRVGVLPESLSLLNLISRKPPPHDEFTGLERITVGLAERSLYEIQEIFSSNVVEITKPLTSDAGCPGSRL
jgi:hypothetical protein